jgi:hypothetical protein
MCFVIQYLFSFRCEGQRAVSEEQHHTHPLHPWQCSPYPAGKKTIPSGPFARSKWPNTASDLLSAWYYMNVRDLMTPDTCTNTRSLMPVCSIGTHKIQFQNPIWMDVNVTNQDLHPRMRTQFG